MKILQVITSLNMGGAEKLLAESIPLYKERGITMDLLLLNGNRTSLYDELECNDVNIHFLTVGAIKNIYNPFIFFKIVPFLREYDLVHVHLFPTQYWVALAKLFSQYSTKLIFTEHSTANRRRNSSILKLVDRCMYKPFSRVISISKECENNLRKHIGDQTNRLSIIENGINLDKFRTATPLRKESIGLEEDSLILCQVSGFREEKDQDTVIRAISELNSRIHLVLVGDGKRRQECEILASELKVEDRVHFLGIRSDVPEIMKMADVIVLSSHWEGFGLAAVEGMAAGKPVLGSNVQGLGDVVRGAGELFERGNHLELAEIVKKLYTDKNYYNELADKCLNKSQKYDINKMVDKYFSVYSEVCNE